MESTINGTAKRFETVSPIGKVNGKVGRPRKQAETVTLPAVANYRQWLTCGMGCLIPILSLLLSHSAGLMLAENCCTMLALGLATLGVCCTLLALSLSHLAWAVCDITRGANWHGWAFAIAIDVSLVLCKLAGVSGLESWPLYTIMGLVTVASMVLNCWAFLQHGKR